MRVAPAAIAFEIGVLFTTPPSISICPPTLTGGSTPGIVALAMIASSASPVVSATSRPDVTSVATTHSGIGASSSRSKRRLRDDERAQAVGRHERVATPEEAEQPGERPQREHVARAERRPDRGEVVESLEARVAGDPRRVERARPMRRTRGRAERRARRAPGASRPGPLRGSRRPTGRRRSSRRCLPHERAGRTPELRLSPRRRGGRRSRGANAACRACSPTTSPGARIVIVGRRAGRHRRHRRRPTRRPGRCRRREVHDVARFSSVRSISGSGLRASSVDFGHRGGGCGCGRFAAATASAVRALAAGAFFGAAFFGAASWRTAFFGRGLLAGRGRRRSPSAARARPRRRATTTSGYARLRARRLRAPRLRARHGFGHARLRARRLRAPRPRAPASASGSGSTRPRGRPG